ncbi:MAG: 4-hydroxythreonine-4-phosphate dehydrogenase PdxA [Nitrospiraceae bacterium]|nr:4-hydroxythreonine-4-phosphate dehydrogenase PdxA [Nitrospiraceae bacterium]
MSREDHRGMKKIAITMGDPAGVGPEIIVRALAHPGVHEVCIPVVIGDRRVLQDALDLSGSRLRLYPVQAPREAAGDTGRLNMIDLSEDRSFEKNRATAEGGRACVKYIRKAVDLALAHEVDAVVTAPITKEALKMAGMHWPGHTEMIAELTSTQDYAMMLSGGPLRVVLTTIHTSIRSVPGLISRESVLRTILLAKRACDMMGIREPKIAVAGLNPHAGEAGMFGDEEQTAIIPAIEAAQGEGIPCTGPYPPDTLFHKAYHGGIDIVVCMYHDQGLIPLKMIAFDTGVNTTIGLPVIRTSPDHGTAYDIAWKGTANPSSLIEAIAFATRLRI